MLRRAVEQTLAAPASERRRLFTHLVSEIVQFMAAHPEERPWTCTIYTGTDGSAIFRGGVGHSLVVDSAGRLWRARSYEDFETTYRFGDGTCEIDRLTPIYAQMREYLPRAKPRSAASADGTAPSSQAVLPSPGGREGGWERGRG